MTEPHAVTTAATGASEGADTEPKHPVAALAAQIKHAKPGTFARLRRIDPSKDPQAALFEVEFLLQAAQIAPRGEDQHQRWALLLHCLAIVQGAHDGRSGPSEAGAVLAKLRVSEARLQQLVEAGYPVLADLMPRLARRLAAAGAAVNWMPLADLVLCVDTAQEARAQAARRRLVRHFLEAQRHADADISEQTAAQIND